MTAGDLVPQNIYLMHSTIFFKHRPQVILVHVVRYLSHKHLYVVRIRLLHTVVVHYGVFLLIAVGRMRWRRLSLLFGVGMVMHYVVVIIVVVMHVHLVGIAVRGRAWRDFTRQSVERL